jgi:alpha-galactosidase
MLPTKIVVIGAGSAIFGLNTLAALMGEKRLRGSQIALVDLDPEALEITARLAERLNQEWDAQMVTCAHTSHTEALEGADYVVLSIEVPPRLGLWRSDFEIPLKFGVRQPYAENGGPGGFAHAARNISPVMEIVRDMERLCPEAWLINYTNPMIRICDAVARYSKIKVVGLCHQINAGYAMVGKALAEELDIQVPEGFTNTHASPSTNPPRHQVTLQALEKIDILAAGLNHFTWMLAVHDRRSGEDLYPLFRERWVTLPTEFEPLTRRVFDAFGVFPIPGDEHLCEYLPWASDPLTKPWQKYDISLYEWDLQEGVRAYLQDRIERMSSGDLVVDDLREADSEGALEMIVNLAGAGCHVHLAVNLPNQGQIENLPLGAIVETPGVVSGAGVKAVAVGALPEAVAELCHREITVAQLCVDAAIHGDRQAALQCLLLDPVITDIDVARSILDAYLEAYRPHLPQFWDGA